MNATHSVLHKLSIFLFILMHFEVKSFGQNLHGRVLDSRDSPVFSAAIIAQNDKSQTVATCITDT